MIFLSERSEFRKIGTGPLNENKAKPRFEFSGIGRYVVQRVHDKSFTEADKPSLQQNKRGSVRRQNPIDQSGGDTLSGNTRSTSRTRWLRRKRPKVLCWERHGRSGGCRFLSKSAEFPLFIFPDLRGAWAYSSAG